MPRPRRKPRAWPSTCSAINLPTIPPTGTCAHGAAKPRRRCSAGRIFPRCPPPVSNPCRCSRRRRSKPRGYFTPAAPHAARPENIIFAPSISIALPRCAPSNGPVCRISTACPSSFSARPQTYFPTAPSARCFPGFCKPTVTNAAPSFSRPKTSIFPAPATGFWAASRRKARC